MKIKILKISSTFSGVISRGSYENSRPGFSAEVEFELDEPFSTNSTEIVDRWQKHLQKVCYDNFKACEEQAVIERVQREKANIHWYPDERGNLVLPGASSIVGISGTSTFISPDELQQYASQSNLCHAQVAHFIKTLRLENGVMVGDWLDAKEVPDTWADLLILSKGDLKLETNGWDFPAFLKKYPISALENAKPSVNYEKRYGGTPDFLGIPEFGGTKGFEHVKKVKTLWDVKRTKELIKNMKQISAYKFMKDYLDVEQIGIVPLNNKTDQGFSKPTIESDPVRIQQYFSMFLKDREEFKKIFFV